jgi:anti-sigma factor ChrR (cupin superfamily)
MAAEQYVAAEQRIHLQRLLDIEQWQHELPWQFFRPGVEIHRLYQQPGGSTCALIRYAPGAAVPLHQHRGYEHILVLSGGQSDSNGHYDTGSLLISPPGSQHQIASEKGCIVLAIWQRDESFLQTD